jgi:hypothetical protein
MFCDIRKPKACGAVLIEPHCNALLSNYPIIKVNNTYQRFGAWAILLIFLTGWSMGTTHRLLQHHEHDGPQCKAKFERNATHLHDERYANDHCTLCAFVLAAPYLLSVSALSAKSVLAPISKASFHLSPSCTNTLHDTTCLRGPPAL